MDRFSRIVLWRLQRELCVVVRIRRETSIRNGLIWRRLLSRSLGSVMGMSLGSEMRISDFMEEHTASMVSVT